MNCGSAIIDQCKGATFPMEGFYRNGAEVPIERRSLTFVSELVSIGSFMITATLAAGTESFTEYQVKGINALRCAFLNGFIQVYLLLASAYYAARQFGFEGDLQGYLNEAYPYICTCKEEVA